eukprot:CAMPEP_0204518898 /NCGR_PEP_ID=MMETSP0661-20131031/4448_1 /ASSEMBLY_ACC=CAM_ASM_000606 /TAXON_ID=109239 /ORGANISM="Alexandrium margalefi, Strain AMGDE01CS-322" /LENGTH=57 /DNA_ID=CAMNT_0051524373 /DNA_START=435 /DNA_END=608 /DNA_ORIENTATION=+
MCYAVLGTDPAAGVALLELPPLCRGIAPYSGVHPDGSARTYFAARRTGDVHHVFGLR